MIAFVTTIRHPTNCHSYLRVSELLSATLRSVCRQSDPDFAVVVVHNQPPLVASSDSRIHYVQVDFPAPSAERKAQIPFNVFARDKGTKCVIGVARAKELSADHVMFFDADDFLHRDIAAHANRHQRHPGWYSPDGYVHSEGLRVIQPVLGDFHLKNGSTGIVRTDLTRVPDSISTRSSQTEIVEALTEVHVDRMFGNHGKWEAHLAASGHQIEPLPFPAAIWEIGTGENLSGNLVSSRSREKISPEIADAFGIRVPTRRAHALATVRLTSGRLRRRLRR